MADLFVGKAIDRFVFPDGARSGGGQRGGVQVIRHRVNGEEGECARAASTQIRALAEEVLATVARVLSIIAEIGAAAAGVCAQSE